MRIRNSIHVAFAAAALFAATLAVAPGSTASAATVATVKLTNANIAP
jgi:hypothetical protein